MTSIYHITHIDNLESIIRYGGLHCDNGRNSRSLSPVGIAHDDIKRRRQVKRVPVGPGGVVADYVPFYFCPRSPMLYSIASGYVSGYTGGQAPIVHLVSSTTDVTSQGLGFTFTDGHATVGISKFFDQLADLSHLDWNVIGATIWNDINTDMDRKRRKQAEFLVHRFAPWDLFTEIGVISDEMARAVTNVIQWASHRPQVMVHRNWYY